jgi:ribosome biogenesis GTPase / thiamine phosphate phosphatase
MNIADYGWEVYRSAVNQIKTNQVDDSGLCPGRVITESSQLYKVYTDEGESWAVLTGSLLNTMTKRSDYPAVGDWLLVDAHAGHQHWIIREVLPRYSTLIRKSAGQTTEAQVLASNVDYVFIVNGLDGGRNFNLRGIERYVTAAWESGAQPAVILNKADLCDDVDGAVLQAETVAPGVPVLAVSALTGEGFEEVAALAAPGRTVVLAGRSGVGKSSIINQLAGEEVMFTGEQREQDLRGRHTTTHRELVRLSSGALLIDTPGLRELQLWADEDSIRSSFPEIDEYAEECRFADCTHSSEPGCAVQQALASGAIEESRYESYLNLRKELKYLHSRQDEKARKEHNAEIKTRGKELARYIKDIKRNGKRPR